MGADLGASTAGQCPMQPQTWGQTSLVGRLAPHRQTMGSDGAVPWAPQ